LVEITKNILTHFNDPQFYENRIENLKKRPRGESEKKKNKYLKTTKWDGTIICLANIT
jgi:hypothetical protein